ncbi:ATP-dependent helicase HrpB [Marichromatium sp. AB31]|nr:ATP-dependent helicase HrpB [Marichromatium sp. AB31]
MHPRGSAVPTARMSQHTPKPAPLPIETSLPALIEALRHGHALLQAPTGSGKSTRAPLALLEAEGLIGGRILMLEPRRPAARMTAARMAALCNEALGETVGYQVRFERRIGPKTRIEVLTEGILTRRLQHDPELSGVDLVIFDEFHERSLHADLGLALVLDVVANLRPELRVLVMSATIEAEPVARLLGGAETISAAGRTYPVTVHHAERPVEQPAGLVGAVVHALAAHDDDILAFLPGVREIERCRAALAPRLGPETDLLALHGSLPTAEQARALAPPTPGRRRVILATDIAETSLTIEGVGVVIDGGLTRKPRFAPNTGLTRLVTEPVSLASAEQRAGRAGRLGPGHCYRLWTREQARGRAAQRDPEILQADLAPLALELALWGVNDPAELAWLDPPPQPAWAQGRALLQTLGALDARGAITALGRALAQLPLHPRLGVMLLGAAPEARALAADLGALLSERDPALDPRALSSPADLGARLQALAQRRARRPTPGFDPRRLDAVARAARQLGERVARASHPPGTARTPGALLALAYPERIAQRRDARGERYLLAAGNGARLDPADALTASPYLVVAELDAQGRDGRIRHALAIDADTLHAVYAQRIHTETRCDWDAEHEAVRARALTRLDALTLEARPLPLPDDPAVLELLREQVLADPERALRWDDDATQLRARIALLRAHDPQGGWPDPGPEGLHARAADWLDPWLIGKSRLSETRRLEAAELLLGLLDWDQRQRLDRAAPTHLRTPAGNQRRLDYASDGPPVLAVPLQELFGLCETPRVCDGRVAVLLHLLSPARRPIQVTQDLASFWAQGYTDVRKELRGRYPKHHWPEDPAAADAVTGGLQRRRR